MRQRDAAMRGFGPAVVTMAMAAFEPPPAQVQAALPQAQINEPVLTEPMPHLFQLRKDQKREVRPLARITGVEKVASMI